MKKIIFILLYLSIFKNTFSQTGNFDKIRFNELDSFVNKVLTDWKVPGLALAVIKDGKVVYSNGYGVKNLKTKEKVSVKTLFSIASVTKTFTSILAGMMYDEKKINWDIPLQTYFPDFNLYDQTASAKITLKDLLTHRSGIPREKFYSLIAPKNRKQTRSDIKYFEPGADFRSTFQYCNETVAVAADMIAEKAGTTWEELITKRIFQPLDMKNTILSYKNLTNKDFATPYIKYSENPEELEYHNADMLGGAGCIISNIEDLSNWAIFITDKGKFAGKQLINQRTLMQLQAPVLYVPGSSKYTEIINQCYGIGWFCDSYRGFRRVHHGGVLYGFSSLISFLPNENIGIVILSNLNANPLPEIIEGYIFDRLLNLKPIDWNQRNIDFDNRIKAYYKNFENKKDTAYKPESKTTLPLDDYEGNYVSKGYGNLIIKKQADSLMTTMLGIPCPLRRYNKDVFELYHPVEHNGWKLTFIINEKKKIDALHIQISPNLQPIVYRKN